MADNPKSTWDNREWRSYTFVEDSAEDAILVEEKESVARRQLLGRSL